MPIRERFKLSLSVFVFLVKGNEVLLLKRAHTGYMDGYYSVPAGALDGGETLKTAAIREAKEEVSVIIQEQDLQLIHIMHNKRNEDEWVSTFFMCTKWKGEPVVNEPEKHSEVRWVEMNNLPENTIGYVAQAIKNIDKEIYSEFGWK